ncbi:hypothetical protein [Cryptosporangium aurantiacum]|uniref:hypothetical protein n=1 Tax=Cryptosporangium aurantiacum TaxID=134849 RepID=UPI001160F20B|nr:hypothetical protein [Cryptosporangium aurantiacum]
MTVGTGAGAAVPHSVGVSVGDGTVVGTSGAGVAGTGTRFVGTCAGFAGTGAGGAVSAGTAVEVGDGTPVGAPVVGIGGSDSGFVAHGPVASVSGGSVLGRTGLGAGAAGPVWLGVARTVVGDGDGSSVDIAACAASPPPTTRVAVAAAASSNERVRRRGRGTDAPWVRGSF